MTRKTDACSLCGTPMYPRPKYQRVSERKAPGRPLVPGDERVCNPCRRANPGYSPTPKPSKPRTVRVVTCACGKVFETTHSFKKWCEPVCSSKPKRVFPAKKRAERRGRYGSAWRRLRQVVLAEERVCWLCDKPVDMARKFPDPWSATVDHVVQAVQGGPSTRENLRLAHFRCNVLRGGARPRSSLSASH